MLFLGIVLGIFGVYTADFLLLYIAGCRFRFIEEIAKKVDALTEINKRKIDVACGETTMIAEYEEEQESPTEGDFYYSAGSGEEHYTESEAVAAFFDNLRDGGDIETVIANYAPLTVFLYEACAPTRQDAETVAQCAAENAYRYFHDLYGNSADTAFHIDESVALIENAPAYKKTVDKVADAFEVFYKRLPVWQSKYSGEREVSAAEILAMLKQERPEWFELHANSSGGGNDPGGNLA